MQAKIGLLLPRSTDYPAMGFDMLDGLRAGLPHYYGADVTCLTESIGFGEDADRNYAIAEKLLLQENVRVLIVYSTVSNALPLYRLALASGKTFLFLDAGMQLPAEETNDCCYHISLQGSHACYLSGQKGAQGGKKMLLATSFYDGGYRGPWSYHTSIAAAGGAVCGNYVSGYKTAEFSIESYLHMLEHTGPQSVAACFSTYLAQLFMQHLQRAGEKAVALPFWCSPFMAEEQLLDTIDFPGGEFHAIVPWASSLRNREQELFAEAISQQTHKTTNIFHLLGWEAAITASRALLHGPASLKGFQYSSPRGTVTLHRQTHHTYAPLYYGNIIQGETGKCRLDIRDTLMVDQDGHLFHNGQSVDAVESGWRNNYFCI